MESSDPDLPESQKCLLGFCTSSNKLPVLEMMTGVYLSNTGGMSIKAYLLRCFSTIVCYKGTVEDVEL